MNENPLRKLGALGQSIWLDYIRRDLIAGGKLQRLVDEDGLRGMTSNPAIFENAIVNSNEYDDDIQSMVLEGTDFKTIYETLSQHDVRIAADVFRPLYDGTDGEDGFVSLEVNPHLAHDTEKTMREARRLWAAVDRPNVMIKVPATFHGLAAIRQLIAEGINVNVTLLFGLPRYRQVAEAYIAGLEARVVQAKPIKNIASVASFFVSRIDALVDPMLEERIAQGGTVAEHAKSARGETAISSAKMAYELFKEIFGGERFGKLVERGGRPQRLLWASTSTKNPDYSDIKYVEALIGPNTVNTIPMETLESYRNHGAPQARLEHDVEKARTVLLTLAELGVAIDDVAQQLEDEGVEKFVQPFDKLLEALAKRTCQQEV